LELELFVLELLPVPLLVPLDVEPAPLPLVPPELVPAPLPLVPLELVPEALPLLVPPELVAAPLPVPAPVSVLLLFRLEL